MSMDVARLGFVIDSSGALKAEDNLDRMTVAAGRAEGAAQDVGAASKTMGAGLNAGAVGAKKMSGAMRIIPMQLSQVAQQGAATGQWAQAFSIQAADIGLAFGTIGIAVGAAISVLGPMAKTLIDAAGDSRSLEDATDDLNTSIGQIEASVQIASMSMDDLIAKYGDGAEAVRDLNAELILLNQQSAMNALQDTIRAGSKELSGFERAMQDVSEARREMLSAQDMDASPVTDVLDSELDRLTQNFTDANQRLKEEFGLTTAQAYRIVDALDDLQEANGPEAAAEAARALTEAITAAVREGASLSQVMIEIGNNGAFAFSAFQQVNAAATESAANIAGMNYGNPDALAGMSGAQLLPPNPGGGGGGGGRRGGGGGMSDAQKQRLELEREAAKVYQQTATSAEKYAMELAKLDTLYSGGFIGADTYSRAVEDLGEQFGQATGALEGLEQTGRSVFTSLLDVTNDWRDVLGNAAGDLSAMFANRAFDNLLGSFMGGGGGGSIFPFAKGGVVGGPTLFPMGGGNTGLMGEAGPEAIMPLERGPDGKLGVRAGGGGSSASFNFAPVIDARGADASAVARLERTVAEQASQFESRVSAFMRESKLSGANRAWR